VEGGRDDSAVLVLASASPRRHQLLAWLGLAYEIDVPDVDERVRRGESSRSVVRRLADAKAAAVAARRPASWVLAADTIVELDGAMLGKPSDRDDAAHMLGLLSGREHRVATGFTLLAPGGAARAADVVVTRVTFRPLDARAIRTYVDTGEPDGKAGGYAIQGFGAGLIERIDGSFTNVIGLPLVEVARALAEAGLLAG
jgi:nucleoside triphosphate pyrophosphatase